MAYQLDQLDLRILDILQHDARLTNKEIGQRLNKSVTPIYERIKRLQELGVIRRYIAVLDPNKINRSLMAFTHVQLKDHSDQSLSNFESEIIKFDEVMECYHMSGVYDFILRVAVSDLPTYHNFLMNKLFKLMAVGSVQSTFVMKEAKTGTAYKLDIDEKVINTIK